MSIKTVKFLDFLSANGCGKSIRGKTFNYTRLYSDFHVHDYFPYFNFEKKTHNVCELNPLELFQEHYKKNTYRDMYSTTIRKLSKELKTNLLKCRSCRGHHYLTFDSYATGHNMCNKCFAKLSSDYSNNIQGNGIFFSDYLDARLMSDVLEEE